MLETSFPGTQLFLTFSDLEKIRSWRKNKHLIRREEWPHPNQGKDLRLLSPGATRSHHLGKGSRAGQAYITVPWDALGDHQSQLWVQCS